MSEENGQKKPKPSPRKTKRRGKPKAYHMTPRQVLVPLGVAAGIAVLIILGGKALGERLSSGAYTDSTKSGSRSMARGDYESAIQSYKDALSQNPDDETVKEDLKNAYLEYSQMYEESGDYNNAVILLRQAVTALQDEQDLQDELANVYKAWAENLAGQGSYDQAVSVLSAGTSYGDMTETYQSVYLAWADSAEQAGNFENALEIISNGQRAAGGDDLEVKAGEIEALQKLYALSLQTKMKTSLGSEQYEAILQMVEDKGGVCQYPDKNMALYEVDGEILLYAGTIEDGLRQGLARWEVVSHEGSITCRAAANFTDDVPQGQFSMSYDDGFGETAAVTGTLVNGLYDGTCIVTDANGAIWDVDYSAGIPQEVGGTVSAGSTEESADAASTDTKSTGTVSVPSGEIAVASGSVNTSGSGVLTVDRDTLDQTRGLIGWGDLQPW